MKNPRALTVLILLAGLRAFAGFSTQTIKDSPGQITLDYRITDSLTLSSAGKPLLPGTLSDQAGTLFFPVTVSLPPGAQVKSAAVSGSAVPASCVFSSSGMVRRAFIAAFRLFPVDNSTGRPRLSTQGRITITYASVLSKIASSAAPDNPLAENALKGVLSNYATSQNYRAPAARVSAKTLAAPFQNAKIKLFAAREGIYAVTYEQIQSLGFSAGSIDPVYFHLYNSERELPVYVETSIKGRFSPGDRILFYGTFEAGTGGRYFPEHTFSRAYYMGWDNIPGLRAPLVSGAPKYLDNTGTIRPYDPTLYTPQEVGIPPVTHFRRTVHVEQDLDIRRLSTPQNTFSSDAAPQDFEYSADDYWLWTDLAGADESVISFALDAAPAGAGTARITVSFLGYTKTGPHNLKLLVNHNSLTPVAGPNIDIANAALVWTGQAPATFVSDATPANLSKLLGGTNTLTVRHSPSDISFLNWIEVEYDAVPGVVNGLDQTISLDTSVVRSRNSYYFSLPSTVRPEIWDKSGRRIVDFVFADNTAEFYDVIGQPASYFVTQQVLSPERISLKPVSDIRSAAHGADLLIITPEALRAEAESYAAFKRARGTAVYIAGVEAIYDEFGDGSVNPDAIKAFVKYAYENFNPSPFYLLILGGTSEGSDKIKRERNLVPAYFIQVDGWGIVAADSRYTTVSGDDLFPDLSVGRIPVNNAAEAHTVLRKIMDYETSSDQGLWKKDYFLIGGQEPTFTAANDRYQFGVLKDRFNVKRVDADNITPSPYSFGLSNPAEVKNVLNQGALFVNFYGHGGGSVWSDGVPPLMNNDAAQTLLNLRRLPIIFSMTCLTASFEALFYEFDGRLTPLGMNMLKKAGGGCAAFYGASGHSFTTPDYHLGQLTMEQAARPEAARVGDIIFNAEELLLASFGTQYFPVVGQYNLLGDPSMPVLRPCSLSVTPRSAALNPGDSLVLFITSDSVTSGEGTVQIYRDDGTLSFYKSFTLSGRQDTVTVAFKHGQTFSPGLARVSVWNSRTTASGQADFALGDVSLQRVRPFLTGASGSDTQYVTKSSIGDAVSFEARLVKPAGCAIDTVYASWNADTSFIYLSGNDTLTNVIPMFQINPGDTTQPLVFRTQSPLFVDPDLFGAVRGLSYGITLVYRAADNERRVYRKFFSMPVAASPDLSFTRTDKISLVLNGRLVARSRFLNYGETAAKPFSIRQTVNDTQAFSVPYLFSLPTAKPDSVEAPVSASGFFKVRVFLDDLGQVAESDKGNNAATAFFGMTGTTLGRLDSVLTGPYGGVLVRAAHAGDTFSLYTVMDNIDSLTSAGKPVFSKDNPYSLAPLQTPYRPLGADSLARYDFQIMADPSMNARDSLVRLTYRFSPSAPAKAQKSAAANDAYGLDLGFYQWEASLGFWKWKSAVVNGADSTVSLVTGAGKRLMPGRKSDLRGPTVTASVNGRVVSYKDYIPLKTAIDIAIQDESAVDTTTVRVFLSGMEPLPRSRYAMGYAGGTGDVSLSFRPFKQGPDSLYVIASDVNGNASDTARIGYQLGSDLSIQSFANHPNPFGRLTTFAFTITDDANVAIRIYTLSGKLIKTFSMNNTIGYHEIPWDARDESGRLISNGTYYLKLTVSNRDRTVEQIHKIACAEGR